MPSGPGTSADGSVVDTGSGDPVVLLPSAGRGAADFDPITPALHDAGLRTLAWEPPRSVVDGSDLFDLARLVCGAVDVADPAPDTFHLVGHAFGNRLARALLVIAPDRVRSLTLLAAGGLIDMADDVRTAFEACFNLSLPPADHLATIGRAFFAPGNDPATWASGWMPLVAWYQGEASRLTDRAAWWSASGPPVLVIQGVDDVIAVPENGRRYTAELKERDNPATLIELEGVGHAMLPEAPGAMAHHLIAHLTGGG